MQRRKFSREFKLKEVRLVKGRADYSTTAA